MEQLSHRLVVLSSLAAGAVLVGAVVAACDSNNSGGGDNGIDTSKLQFDMGGVVSGIDDTHCNGDGGVIKLAVTGACTPEGGAPAAPTNTDGGASDYGPTHYNNIAYDDDCKYVVRWEATPIRENQNVYFQVTATTTVDGTAVAAQTRNGVVQGPTIEAYLDDTHPAGTNGQRVTQTLPGVYVIGPVKFDAPGTWTVRFHFNGDCENPAPDSPHGHVAFFVGVP
jgi:hypothetical protein